METITVSNLSFYYPNSSHPALKNISFSVKQGEFITLCGQSASGKSTLLRQLKPVLSPRGKREGNIAFLGKDINALTLREQSEKIGFVGQSVENQLVTDKVWHELAFALENLGYDNHTIRRRVAETASFFGIENYFEKNVSELSGGQKQLLSLASVMAVQPDLLILDEPTSQLDPIAASLFIDCLHKLNRELGVTIIMTEHRLEEVFSISDRVIVIENGSVISDAAPCETGNNLKRLNSDFFISLPAPIRVRHIVGGEGICPVTVTEGRQWLYDFSKSNTLITTIDETIQEFTKTAVELKNIYFRYDKNSPDVLKDLSLYVKKGEFMAILGGNGAGKTTLLSVINRQNKPYSGNIKFIGNSVTLPQNPSLILSENTVKKCLLEAVNIQKNDRSAIEVRINEIAELCGIEALLYRHPFDLSGGEQQKAALAVALLCNPDLLLLDEPTKGLDADFKSDFADILLSLKKAGKTIIMVSHDIEFCAEFSDKCVFLFNGEAIAEGTPRDFFCSNSFYVTSARRMSKGIIDNAITANDIILCCTGKKPGCVKKNKKISFSQNTDLKERNEKKLNKIKNRNNFSALNIIGLTVCALAFLFGLAVNFEWFGQRFSNIFPFGIKIILIFAPPVVSLFFVGSQGHAYNSAEQRKLSKRAISSIALILLAVPVTIFIGTTYLNDDKYLFISLLIVFECIIPFFIIFEGKRPQARELVAIATLCALAIAARSMFYAFPQFKPITAVVIISGIALGGESGFIIGAVSMLVSNIYFGQGAWTPWQMFAMGFIGFLAGTLFKKGLLSKNRFSLSVFGFIITVLIYGGIMNFATLILTRAPINTATLSVYYAQGLPMDLVHAVSVALVLFFGSKSLLNIIDRIKTKYGIAL